MRHKIIITVEEDTLGMVKEAVRSKTFRNGSHFFEIATSKLISGVKRNG
ncbi:MAG: hypothetical protein Q7K43_00795 [Candidatus Woesearchaeota archaeon]|nr:hypothetical protein [Candidatus Woesearchaeota archaeon]